MREIKFRAWDTFDKRMIEWKDCLEHETLIPEILLNNARYIPLQYIGLKDKNGTEIYERDIVNIVTATPDGPMGGIGEVFYREDAPEFMVETFAKHPRWWGWAFFTTSEVLGNIYENPELMS
jgi:uncharacterized phage protein (TIGR01671 family)